MDHNNKISFNDYGNQYKNYEKNDYLSSRIDNIINIFGNISKNYIERIYISIKNEDINKYENMDLLIIIIVIIIREKTLGNKIIKSKKDIINIFNKYKNKICLIFKNNLSHVAIIFLVYLENNLELIYEKL